MKKLYALIFFISVSFVAYAQKGRLVAHQSIIYANHDNTLVHQSFGGDGGFGHSLRLTYYLTDRFTLGLEESFFRLHSSNSDERDGIVFAPFIMAGYHHVNPTGMEPYLETGFGVLNSRRPGVFYGTRYRDLAFSLRAGSYLRISDRWNFDFSISFTGASVQEDNVLGQEPLEVTYTDQNTGRFMSYFYSSQYYYVTFGIGLSYSIFKGGEN